MIGSAYLAAEDFQTPLAEELRRRGITISRWHGRLALSPDSPVQAARALDIWTEPRDIEVPSIRDAADAMRGMQRDWAAYGAAQHRRMALIAKRLPPVKARALRFPEAAPASHLGAWTLLGHTGCWPARSSPARSSMARAILSRTMQGPPAEPI